MSSTTVCKGSVFDYAESHISMTINKHQLSFLPEATGRHHLEKPLRAHLRGALLFLFFSEEKSSTMKKNKKQFSDSAGGLESRP